MAPHMCVPEIPQVRVTAQTWNDANKYGPYCELFFLLISMSQIGQRDMCVLRAFFSIACFFAQPRALLPQEMSTRAREAPGVSSRHKSERPQRPGGRFSV